MSQLLNVLFSTDPLPHFTHVRHPLKLVPNEYEFMCDGCNIPGGGERYHCKECQFDLHKECAISPANLSTHFHPNHQLVRTWERPDVAAVFLGNRPCNVCEEQVTGLFFTCPVSSCNFFLHPLCSMFPESVRHVIDTKHPLTFQDASESMCNICGHNCTGMRYRCEPCRINIHIGCLTFPPANHDLRLLNLESRGYSPPKSRRPLHDHHQQDVGTGVGIQSSRPQDAGTGGVSIQSSPSYGSPNYQSSNYQYPYQPEGGYGTPGNAVEMQSPSYGLQQYQPINNNQGPHKPEEGHDGSSGGKKTGEKRKKVYAIVTQLSCAVAASAIIGIPGFVNM